MVVVATFMCAPGLNYGRWLNSKEVKYSYEVCRLNWGKYFAVDQRCFCNAWEPFNVLHFGFRFKLSNKLWLSYSPFR